MKVAVLGCGYWGSKHVRVLNSIPDVEQVVAVDFRDERLTELRREFPAIGVFQRLEDALDEIDAVIVATPPDTHARCAMTAMHAGKSVLVEKPLATSTLDARQLVEKLGSSVSFYKIGLELSTSGEYYTLLDWLVKRGNRVFCDLKLHDIPETVRRAVANLRGGGAAFLTVHGHRSVMEAAAREKGAMKILAVTVLTSFDQRDLQEFETRKTVEDLVLSRARGAAESGCDGVIASGLEAKALKAEFQQRLLVVTPGIRPAAGGGDDQKRTVDVAQAFAYGADYIVVGRPIRDAKDPRAAAENIQRTIASVFTE